MRNNCGVARRGQSCAHHEKRQNPHQMPPFCSNHDIVPKPSLSSFHNVLQKVDFLSLLRQKGRFLWIHYNSVTRCLTNRMSNDANNLTLCHTPAGMAHEVQKISSRKPPTLAVSSPSIQGGSVQHGGSDKRCTKRPNSRA